MRNWRYGVRIDYQRCRSSSLHPRSSSLWHETSAALTTPKGTGIPEWFITIRIQAATALFDLQITVFCVNPTFALIVSIGTFLENLKVRFFLESSLDTKCEPMFWSFTLNFINNNKAIEIVHIYNYCKNSPHNIPHIQSHKFPFRNKWCSHLSARVYQQIFSISGIPNHNIRKTRQTLRMLELLRKPLDKALENL